MPIGLGYGGYRKIKKPGMKSKSHSVMRSVGKTSNLAFACATGTLQTFAPPRMSDLLLPLIFWHPMKSAAFWGRGSIRLADVLGHQHIVRADDLAAHPSNLQTHRTPRKEAAKLHPRKYGLVCQFG